MDEAMLHRYAELAVFVGVDLDPGRRVLLRSPLEAAPLARRIVEVAYRAGAPYVHVAWTDEAVTRSRFLHAPEGSFGELPLGGPEAMDAMAARGDAVISIDASDPEGLADVDPQRVATARAARSRAFKPFTRRMMGNEAPWTIVAVPTPAWARQVFPDDDEATAVRRLWEAIRQATRLDRSDPVAAWRDHLAALGHLSRFLNDRRYDALRFRGPGTDLTVGLAEQHLWHGGASRTPDGRTFVPNLPTEEVFTAPHRERVHGTVRASLPLFQGGRRIDGFELRFEDGVVVDARADVGQEVLDRLLDTDAGARRLGEIALVSVDSPIHRTGTVFRNTLFDENAASHVALGEAYRFCSDGGVALDDDAAGARGLNDSLVHVDFMIGSPETDVDGLSASGAAEPLMRSGRFVLET
ncbi:MAG: aminopeptidase [Trueperaceae bacterium]